MLATLTPTRTNIVERLDELPFGATAQINTSEGRVAAFLAYMGDDRRLGIAKYALRILNGTSVPVTARLYADARGTLVSAYPSDIKVPPFGLRDDVIPVRADTIGRFDRAIVRVQNAFGDFTVEAPAPARRTPARLKIGLCIAAAIALLGAAGFEARPRIVAFDAPEKVLTGGTAQVLYQTSGAGAVRYQLASRDGVQLAAGFTPPSGELRLPLPRDGSGAPYVLRLQMQNALFADERIASIATIGEPVQRKVPHAATDPAIANLSVSPAAPVAGSDVRVTYATHADGGSIALVDEDGRTWSTQQLMADGVSNVTIPLATSGHAMRLIVDASEGKRHAQSSVGVTVLANANATPVHAATTQSPARKRPTFALELSTAAAAPGDMIVIRATGNAGDVKVTMTTESGAVVAQGDVSESGGALSLQLPSSLNAATYYVTGTTMVGSTQQTVLRRLNVSPR